MKSLANVDFWRVRKNVDLIVNVKIHFDVDFRSKRVHDKLLWNILIVNSYFGQKTQKSIYLQINGSIDFVNVYVKFTLVAKIKGFTGFKEIVEYIQIHAFCETIKI